MVEEVGVLVGLHSAVRLRSDPWKRIKDGGRARGVRGGGARHFVST